MVAVWLPRSQAPKRTLWRLRIADSPHEVSAAAQISLTTSTGFSPRLGPDYLLYVSATGTGESIWKLANGTSTELWRGEGAQIFGGPAISPDGRSIAFSVRQHGRTLLYVMQADGTNARIVTDSLDSAGQSRMGARRPIDHLGGRRSRLPTSSAFRSTAAPPLLLSATTRSIQHGRPTAALLSTPDPTSARHFL